MIRAKIIFTSGGRGGARGSRARVLGPSRERPADPQVACRGSSAWTCGSRAERWRTGPRGGARRGRCAGPQVGRRRRGAACFGGEKRAVARAAQGSSRRTASRGTAAWQPAQGAAAQLCGVAGAGSNGGGASQRDGGAASQARLTAETFLNAT